MARNRTRQGGMWLAAAALTAMAGVASYAPAHAQQPTSTKPEKIDLAKMEKRDSIIFHNGNKVEGVILEETDTTIKFLLIVSSLRSEVTYNKADILDVRRNEFAASTDEKKDDKKDEKKDDAPPASGNTDPGVLKDVKGKEIAPGTMKVYVLTLHGEIGHDVSKTPMKAAMDDIVRVQPEVLIVRFENEFSQHGEEKGDGDVDPYQYDMLEKARELDTLLTDRVNLGGDFKTKPKMVAWVKKALGGAAFLPFTFQDIYFTSDGLHGGLGALEFLFQGRGDEVVRQKQRSLRLARAIGLAEKGGHDKRIMQAMSLGNFILSYRVVGGQVEFKESMPPDPEWYLLKDDGWVNEEHRDSMQERIRLTGNDFLTLNSKTAYDIGFSKGTADTVDELLSKLNVTRDYAIVAGKSDQIFKDWSTDVTRTEREVRKLIQSYRSVAVKAPGQYEQRTAARGQRKAILRQIQSVVKLYAEAINPAEVGDPDQILGQIDVAIDRIETEQRLDRRP